MNKSGWVPDLSAQQPVAAEVIERPAARSGHHQAAEQPAQPQQPSSILDALSNGFRDGQPAAAAPAPSIPASAKDATPESAIEAYVGTGQPYKNVKAFIETVSKAEGTYGKGDDGYNVAIGGRLFDSYADHPRMRASFTDLNGRKSSSDAAGKLQLMGKTYEHLREKLGLEKGFWPGRQITYHLELFKDAKALPFIVEGDFRKAIHLLNHTYASLPGSPFNQATVSMAFLEAAYAEAGGFNKSAGQPELAANQHGKRHRRWRGALKAEPAEGNHKWVHPPNTGVVNHHSSGPHHHRPRHPAHHHP